MEEEGDYDWDTALQNGRIIIDIDNLTDTQYAALSGKGEGKMKAETVRKKVDGDYQKAVEVYGFIAMVYDKPSDAPKKAWERAIKLVLAKVKP